MEIGALAFILILIGALASPRFTLFCVLVMMGQFALALLIAVIYWVLNEK